MSWPAWPAPTAWPPSTGTRAGALVQVGEATVVAVLQALGLDVSSPARRSGPPSRRSACATGDACCRRCSSCGRERTVRLWVHVPDGRPVRVWIDTEDGAAARPRPDGLLGRAGRGRRRPDRRGQLPGARATCPSGGTSPHAESDGTAAVTPVVVAPRRLDPEAIAGDRQWGLMTPGLRDAVDHVVGHGRPARPRRPGQRGAAATSAPGSSSSTRCTRPHRCRRWLRRPTCR